jgi:hypothetical protein
MRRIFNVVRPDQQLAAASIVRSCPEDWKQGGIGAALANASIKTQSKRRRLPLIFLVFFTTPKNGPLPGP